MITRKLSTGNYQFVYRGYTLTLSRVEGHPFWFFTYEQPDGEFYGACDWYSSKKIAIKAAIEWVDMIED